MHIGTKPGVVMVCWLLREQIEEVEEFTHVINVSKKGGTDEDIQARIGKGRQVFVMPKPICNLQHLQPRPSCWSLSQM